MFVDFGVSQQGVSVAAACGALPASEMTPLELWSMYLLNVSESGTDSTNKEPKYIKKYGRGPNGDPLDMAVLRSF